ncbi:DUF6090 family protein [Psychroserpens sp. SPM9]|uniref:DUF6090 family protein n=1 Tax=Psychroserpens sp. SPM9 TaxID=2975598 RepID=UPI0021A4067B|nr:DUF6090 family protein [Psychroserpens sp. SPM9]MDG5491595.1 DUF6090 family protein [Psychroserpens sp. SPM9]
MGIFNKKRMGFISKKGLYKYLMYGIGEIVLVVIGILIAISINNNNEIKASKNRLNSYLEVYHQDLVIDTTIVAATLNYIDNRKEAFHIFLSDTVEAVDYMRKPQGFQLALSYSPFRLQEKGINLLDNYVDNTKVEQDTLVSQILANHRLFDNQLQEINKRIGDDIDNNMLYLKENEPWIADLLLGKMTNPNVLPYFLSDHYKARLAVHYGLVFQNLYPTLSQLKKNQTAILEEIDKRLHSEK